MNCCILCPATERLSCHMSVVWICVLRQSISLLQERLCTETIDCFTTKAIVYWDDRFLHYRNDCVWATLATMTREGEGKYYGIDLVTFCDSEYIFACSTLLQERLCTGAIDSFTTGAIVYWDNRFLYYRSGCALRRSISSLQERLCTKPIDFFTTRATVYWDNRFLH